MALWLSRHPSQLVCLICGEPAWLATVPERLEFNELLTRLAHGRWASMCFSCSVLRMGLAACELGSQSWFVWNKMVLEGFLTNQRLLHRAQDSAPTQTHHQQVPRCGVSFKAVRPISLVVVPTIEHVREHCIFTHCYWGRCHPH